MYAYWLKWLWGVCVCVCVAKLVPLAYGIKKLQIACVVEDDKVRHLHQINKSLAICSTCCLVYVLIASLTYTGEGVCTTDSYASQTYT